MSYSYFYKTDLGLNADLERHMAKERDLNAKIAELEAIEDRDKMQVATLRMYRDLLAKLLESKANVVSKLGRNTK